MSFSLYPGSSGSGSSSKFSLYTSSSGSSKHKSAHGVVGFFENLGKDVRDATVGLPMGLYNTVAHPIRTAKQTAKVEWQQWSPLAHGDFGKFGHQFVQHPLGPILDIAAVASLGLGATARVAETGALGARAAELATRESLPVRGALASDPEMTRVLSRRPAARLRQNIVHEVTGRTHPFRNEQKLYSTLASKEATRQQIAMNAHMDALAKAHQSLQDPAAQRSVFENMYWQIRKGPARSVKLSSLEGSKAPHGWRFVTENTGGLTAAEQGLKRIEAGDNEVLFPNKGGFSRRKVQGFRERPEASATPRAASANAGKAVIEPDGSISVTGGYKKEGGVRAVNAPDGHVFVPTKGGYKLVPEEKTIRPDLFDHAKNPTAAGGGDFVKELYAADQRFTTTDLSKAAKMNGGKHVLIVPDKAVRAYSHEAGASASFIRKAYDKPTKVWRAAVLNMRPAYIVNNAVGNAFMYMMNHSDYTGMRAWVDSVKQVKGARYVQRMADTGLGHQRWMERHFGDEVGNTLGGYATEGFGNSKIAKLGKGVQPLNIKMERMFRRALINSEVRRSSEVQALMKRGMGYDEAASKALASNPGLRARVLEHAHNTLGDYQALSKTDRAIRDVIPFWAWDKTIARHTAKLVDEQPVKAALGANISTQGSQSTQNALGAIPDFLKGAIPLPSWAPLGPTDPGRVPIMTTQGINPYSTIPDLADSVTSVLGMNNQPPAESVGSLIGPIPQVLAETITKQRFSGAPIPDKHMGSFGNALYDLITNLPPAQLAAAATGHLPPSTSTNKRTGAKKNKLYQKDWESIVSSWLGVPTRKLDKQAAANYLASQENQRHYIGLSAP